MIGSFWRVKRAAFKLRGAFGKGGGIRSPLLPFQIMSRNEQHDAGKH